MILTPTTYEEVSEHLQQASNPLSIHSALPASSFGEDILSLHDLNSMLLYEPEEMIVQAQAGITLEALNAELQSHGQWIPTLVFGENIQSTLGAAIATNTYHPRSAVLGSLRTAILGGTFAAGDGTIFKSGSRVVKSVAGYDIHRAYCGSHGRFGAILDLTLKVQPIPEHFLWFSANESEQFHSFYPTIAEADTTSAFYELAGFTEDIEHDRTELSKLGVTFIEASEAREKIRKIIRSRAIEQSENIQLQKVQRVFDPKGVLR